MKEIDQILKIELDQNFLVGELAVVGIDHVNLPE